MKKINKLEIPTNYSEYLEKIVEKFQEDSKNQNFLKIKTKIIKEIKY